MSATNSAGTGRRDLRGAVRLGARPGAVRGSGPDRLRGAGRRHQGRRWPFAAACKLASNRKSISCAVSSNTTAKFSGTIRLQGHKTASASKSGKKKVTLTVQSAKALKKGTEGRAQAQERQDHEAVDGQGLLATVIT